MNELFLAVILIGNMQITSYRSVEAQTDDTPFITATGDRTHHNGIALSRDLLHRWGGPIDYGDLLYIEGFGFKRVNDCMNKRHKNSVDMWVATYEEEKAVGVRQGRIWLIRSKEDR